MSAVLFVGWAQLKGQMQKKGESQTVGRSRNYAFGKPGSMEPDSSLNLGPRQDSGEILRLSSMVWPSV
jgi:hypothetical protein